MFNIALVAENDQVLNVVKAAAIPPLSAGTTFTVYSASDDDPVIYIVLEVIDMEFAASFSARHAHDSVPVPELCQVSVRVRRLG